MSHHKELDQSVSNVIGTYVDAIEAKAGLRWLLTSGAPGLMSDANVPP
jgi:hypothetical protein